MLKIKQGETSSQRKLDAKKEVTKDDNKKGFLARIPKDALDKFWVSKIKLGLDRDKWLVEKIEELYRSCSSASPPKQG